MSLLQILNLFVSSLSFSLFVCLVFSAVFTTFAPLLFHLRNGAIQLPRHSREAVTETNAGPGLEDDNIVC